MKINRPFMRELAKRAGYTVHQRSSHGPGPAWDWGPKGPMQSSIFNSEERAWADLEEEMHRKLVEAEKLVGLVPEIIRDERAGKTTKRFKMEAHAKCRKGWCDTAHVRFCPKQKR